LKATVPAQIRWRYFFDFQDLQKGTKILSADDASMEVIKVEKQKTNKLLELERPDNV
jgi:hypothetical protein